MKRTLILSAMLATAAFGYERLQGPTELLFCNKEKALNGYTLFGVGSRTFLLDMEGRIVHTWAIGTNPHLLDNGNILDASKDDPSGFSGFTEVDWDGKKVWEYTEKRENYAPHHDWVRIFRKGFFSHIGSSGQRLPNGSTFICSDTEGHFFEVTDKGELVWEYINPVTRDGAVKTLGDVLPMTNSAFRAYRYPADHPAFKGRDLTPKGTITERAAQGIDKYPKRGPGDGKGKGKDDRRGKGKGGKGGGGGGDNQGDRPQHDRPQEK